VFTLQQSMSLFMSKKKLCVRIHILNKCFIVQQHNNKAHLIVDGNWPQFSFEFDGEQVRQTASNISNQMFQSLKIVFKFDVMLMTGKVDINKSKIGVGF